VASLTCQSRRPHSHPNQHTEAELKLIRDMRRRNPELGMIELWHRLRLRGYTRCPESLFRIMRKMGMFPAEKPKKTYKPKPYEQMTHPGERIQVDVKVVPPALQIRSFVCSNTPPSTSSRACVSSPPIRQEEPRLLLDAKAKMPRLLPGYADILVVDKMGKDISGDGMDPNITGRFCQYYTGKPNFTAKRVAVLDLTEATHGNFIGIEAADVTTRRVIDKADPEQT